MATTMMRVREDIHGRLQQLAQDEAVSMQSVLERALEDYRRARLFERASAAYAAMRANPDAWQRELQERAEWDVTLADNLDEADDEAFASWQLKLRWLAPSCSLENYG